MLKIVEREKKRLRKVKLSERSVLLFPLYLCLNCLGRKEGRMVFAFHLFVLKYNEMEIMPLEALLNGFLNFDSFPVCLFLSISLSLSMFVPFSKFAALLFVRQQKGVIWGQV